MCLFDCRGVLQLLANGATGHGGKHELCGLSDGRDCYLQPGLLPRLGEESVHGAGDRGDVNA